MVSTPSSSNERTTAWAPVSCCGATRLAAVVPALPVVWAAAPPSAGAVGSGGRVVGALTMSSFSVLFILRARKNPRQLRRLYEGCALVRVAMPGTGQARHQRAGQVLREFRRT